MISLCVRPKYIIAIFLSIVLLPKVVQLAQSGSLQAGSAGGRRWRFDGWESRQRHPGAWRGLCPEQVCDPCYDVMTWLSFCSTTSCSLTFTAAPSEIHPSSRRSSMERERWWISCGYPTSPRGGMPSEKTREKRRYKLTITAVVVCEPKRRPLTNFRFPLRHKTLKTSSVFWPAKSLTLSLLLERAGKKETHQFYSKCKNIKVRFDT